MTSAGCRPATGARGSASCSAPGNLAHLDDAGVAALRRLGLKRIIDLRADDEVLWAPSRLGDIAVTTQRAPLFLGSVESFFANDVSLDEMYRRLVEDSADRVVGVVRGILADQPVLVHCTVGKDRTGVTVALALAAAGVDEDAVVADYARTEGLLPESRNRRVVRMLRAMHPRSVHLEDLVMHSPAPVMAALLARVTRAVRLGGRTTCVRTGSRTTSSRRCDRSSSTTTDAVARDADAGHHSG